MEKLFAGIDDVQEGTMLVADGGFTCIKEGTCMIVRKDNHGLYVPCKDGNHYIDGQLDDGDVYIGLYLAE